MTPLANFTHVPVIPPRLVTDIEPPDAAVLERFRTVGAADVADLVGPLYVLSPELGPLYRPMRALCGWALTVKAWPGDNLAVHGGLAHVEPGCVLVVDWRGYVGGCGSGAQSLVEPFRHGLRGVVVDGGWRDVEELQALDFPVYARTASPASPPKEQPGEINVPISCGGVVIEPGDVVVADADGIAVVPRRYAELVAEHLGRMPSARSAEEQHERAQRRAAVFHERFDAAGGTRD